MPFGKHKGVPLADLPDDYLHWLDSLADLREPLASWVADELDAREAKAYPPPPPNGNGLPPTLRTVADAIVAAGYRAEAKHAHPDAGGSTQAMQELNAAVAWLRRQVTGEGGGR
jgi:hypothetical protein